MSKSGIVKTEMTFAFVMVKRLLNKWEEWIVLQLL